MRYAGIRAEGFKLLKALSLYSKPVSSNDLADSLSMPLKSVQQQLRRFVDKMLIDATMGDTARGWRFFISAAGRKALEHHEREVADLDEDESPRVDSAAIIAEAMRTQPSSVFDLARVMRG